MANNFDDPKPKHTTLTRLSLDLGVTSAAATSPNCIAGGGMTVLTGYTADRGMTSAANELIYIGSGTSALTGYDVNHGLTSAANELIYIGSGTNALTGYDADYGLTSDVRKGYAFPKVTSTFWGCAPWWA